MPEISVIVPIYNVEKFLKRCVDSILAQTFVDFELWLVDDGSPDKCGEICDEYAKRDARIRVIHKPNGGLSDARNVALDQATGKYISFVDSDDWVAPEFLEEMISAVKRNGAEVSVCNFIQVNEKGEKRFFYKPVDCETVITGSDIYKILDQPNATNKLFLATLFQTVRFPVGRLFEDVYFIHHILMQVNCLVLTGKDLYFYYVRTGSIVHNKNGLKSTDSIDGYAFRAEDLEKINQNRYANKARLIVYRQIGEAFAVWGKYSSSKKRLKELTTIYKRHYPYLIADHSLGLKQKLRLRLLHVSPFLHSLVYHKKLISIRYLIL